MSERTIIKDTTIYVHIPGDTIHDTVIAKDGAFSILTTGYANSLAWINGGKLFHKLEQPEKVLPVTIRQAEKTTIINPPKAPAPPGRNGQGLTFLQKIQIFMGKVLLIVLVGWILMRIVSRSLERRA